MAQPTDSTITLHPRCFDWEDTRTYNRKGRVQSGRYTVKGTDDVYGVVPHTNAEFQQIFQTLASTQLLYMTFVRIPNRIYNMINGNFIHYTYESAELAWLAKNSKKSQIGKTFGSAGRLYQHISIAIWELAKEIIKIVTYPLAIVALQFSALYGYFIHPLDGLRMWSFVESTWSCSIKNKHVYLACDDAMQQALAPCMHTKRFWDEKNLYAFQAYYHPYTLRSRILEINQLLTSQKNFLENEGLDVARTLSQMDVYYNGKLHSCKSCPTFFKQEISKHGAVEVNFSGYINHDSRQKFHAEVLEQIFSDLQTFQQTRLKIISAQNAISNKDESGNKAQRAILADAELQRKNALDRLNHFCDYWQFNLPFKLHKEMGCTLKEQHQPTYTLRGRIRAIKKELNAAQVLLIQQGVNVNNVLARLHVYQHYKAPNSSISVFRESLSDTDWKELNYRLTTAFDPTLNAHTRALNRMLDDISTICNLTPVINESEATVSTPNATPEQVGQYYANREIREFAIQRLNSPCLYWRQLIPLEMHAKMGCMSMERLCYSDKEIPGFG